MATLSQLFRGRSKQVDLELLSKVADLMIGSITDLREQLRRLEGEIEKLKTKSAGLRYKGVFSRGEIYRADDAVTFNGSMWIALRETMSGPPGPDWQLAVKRGRDASRGGRHD